MNGKLITYENNNMSLSCRGEITIENGTITEINFNGYPRTEGDGWIYYYRNFFSRGNLITQEIIDKILDYNGKYNVVSKFIKNANS